MASKRAQFLIIALGATAASIAVATFAGWQFFIQSHEGYFSPVFSPDRRSVYFIERRTRGFVWGLGVEHFTPPAHAYVLNDEISLKRLDRDSGGIETLAHWPSSPLVRKHTRNYRNRIFSVLSAQLQFNDEGDLDFAFGLSIPRQPRSESWSVRGRFAPGAGNQPLPNWQSGERPLYGHARYVLDGDWELIHFYGEAAFPPAISLYRKDGNQVRIIKRAPGFDEQYPDGIPTRLLADRSVRRTVEHLDALADTRQRLLASYRARGLSEGDAMLRTTDALRSLGFYATPETLTAHPVTEAPAGAAVFEISAREFTVGLFQDIGKAIQSPGTRVEKNMGKYVRHRDFDTSERLNRFLENGGTRFFVKTEDGIHEIEITPSRPATR